MNRATLIAQLTGSMLDTATAFLPADFERHIDLAVGDYSRFCPQSVTAEIALVSGLALYPCPDDLVRVLECDWGRDFKATRNPWDVDWPGRLPEIAVAIAANGRRLRLTPAPNYGQIAALGSTCPYLYAANHCAAEDHYTLRAEDEPVVILRAQAEAMRELAMKSISKPMQLRDGMSQSPKNGTPAYLYGALMHEFANKVAR